MKRALKAAGVYALATCLAVCVYVPFFMKQDEPPAAHTEKTGAVVIMSPLEAIEKQRNFDLQIEAFKKEAVAAHLMAQVLQEENAKLKAQLATVEAELAKAKAKPPAQIIAPSITETFEASHYTAYCEGCSGVTATGLDVSNTVYTPEGYRIVATDPRVISLGTVIQVTYTNGTTFKAVAADTGGAIKGRKLDVLVASRAEAYELGRVNVEVQIVGK